MLKSHAAFWNACKASPGGVCGWLCRQSSSPDFSDNDLSDRVEKPCDGHGFCQEQLVSLPETSPSLCGPYVPGPEDGRATSPKRRGTAGAGPGGSCGHTLHEEKWVDQGVLGKCQASRLPWSSIFITHLQSLPWDFKKTFFSLTYSSLYSMLVGVTNWMNIIGKCQISTSKTPVIGH